MLIFYIGLCTILLMSAPIVADWCGCYQTTDDDLLERYIILNKLREIKRRR